MRISDWSSDVCSSDLPALPLPPSPASYRPPVDETGGRTIGDEMTDSDTPRILLIDDEPSIREPLGEYLEAQGFAVSAAARAAEARSILRAQGVDLVVSDIMMPGEDGLSLTRHLRETSSIPVILLTARAEATERNIGPGNGAAD